MSQATNTIKNFMEQTPWHSYFCHLKYYVSRVPDHFCTIYNFLSECSIGRLSSLGANLCITFLAKPLDIEHPNLQRAFVNPVPPKR